MPHIRNGREKLCILVLLCLYCLIAKQLGIPCFFWKLTGISCPGCGMTRAALSLLRLDIGAAIQFHPLILLSPLMLLYFLFDGSLFKKYIDRVILLGIGVAFLGVWILRIIGILPLPR